MKRERMIAGLSARILGAGALGGTLASALALSAALPGSAIAQTPQSAAVARGVMANGPAAAAARDLSAALARLARNPRDVDALVAAGTAALAAGDADASLGFFTRADELAKDNPRVKAGLASAMVRSEDPYDAIPLFEAAERAGAIDSKFVGERGLAYDLVGDNPSAQRYYLDALSHGGNDEITRRLAISYAIVGRRSLAEAALLPQLQRQDAAAWRARAFVMAILGSEDEAISIAYATMPKELAAGISPYLRYMVRLTPAQQAAAANFGHFPRAADIGRDDPRTLRFAVAVPRGANAGRGDSSLIPAGQPLGRGPQVASAAPAESRDSRERRRRPGSEQASAAGGAAGGTGGIGTTGGTGGSGGRSGAVPPPEIAPAQVAVRELPARAPAPSEPAVRAVAAPVRSAAGTSPVAARIVVPAPAPVVIAPRVAVSAAPVAAAPVRAIVLPPIVQTAIVPAPAVPAPAVPAATSAPARTATSAAVLASRTPAPGFDLAALATRSPPRTAETRPAAATVSAPMPVPAPVTAPAPASASSPASAARAIPPPSSPARSLADAFGDLAATTSSTVPAAGAVDMRTINQGHTAAAPAAATTARAGKPLKPAVTAPPPPPAHPSRIWVQLGTGRDKAALAFDWRRMGRSAVELLRARKPYVAAWGQTNRLLTGPFETEAAASAFLAQARRAGADGFLWTSPAGQVVDSLPVGR